MAYGAAKKGMTQRRKKTAKSLISLQMSDQISNQLVQHYRTEPSSDPLWSLGTTSFAPPAPPRPPNSVPSCATFEATGCWSP